MNASTPQRLITLCAVAGLAALSASAWAAAGPEGQTPGYAPDLLSRTVQRSGAGQVRAVLVRVPVQAGARGQALALTQARHIRASLVKQGVDSSNVYIEARSPTPVDRITVAALPN